MNIDTVYASDAGGLVGVLSSAFAADPLAAWLFPDEGRRAAYQEGFYRSLLGRPRAEAHVAGAEGAALWLRLDRGERLDAGSAPPGGPLARLFSLGAALGERHPVDRPHLYLAVMGVVPASQGRGIGSALLRHGLALADRDGLPAYLEASSPGSRSLYLRHGFADLGGPVRVEGAPPVQPMRREPAAADS
ncbi:GNAT family N-acetyltransferase [Glycomyces sp. MUSA5-2]|uniref:GNAT family N-acetyltransferase n=1 Tax=Glycomyces sp. MUSA5-2 TaxID=2053002 RepID=UPI0030087A14